MQFARRLPGPRLRLQLDRGLVLRHVEQEPRPLVYTFIVHKQQLLPRTNRLAHVLPEVVVRSQTRRDFAKLVDVARREVPFQADRP